jgi:hypothetical protein
VSRPGLALIMLVMLGACTGTRAPDAADPPAQAAVARRIVQLGNWLHETSGLAVSRRHPGILWTHNDSGGDPVIFATDTLGADRGRFALAGAENRDWEDLALGPCPQGDCLYVADTGDNPERRPTVTLYRVAEPDPARPGEIQNAERLEFRYPDQPRDVEAIFVAPDTSVHLISKGTRSEIVHYRLPASAWRAGQQATAERLPMPTLPQARRRLVTGATIGLDGAVLLLTYRDLWRLALAPDGALVSLDPPLPCDLGRALPQAEAVTWFGEDGAALLSSEAAEGQQAQLMLVRCP